MRSPSRFRPACAASSSWTILTSCCPGRHAPERRDAGRLLLHALQEFAGELEIDVGLEEDAANLAHPFLDVGFRQNTAPAEARKYGVELFAQFIEHSL